MKQLLLALAIGLTAMGCNRNGKEDELTSELTGTWRLTEYYDVILNWRKVPKESQYTYTFKKIAHLLLPSLKIVGTALIGCTKIH